MCGRLYLINLPAQLHPSGKAYLTGVTKQVNLGATFMLQLTVNFKCAGIPTRCTLKYMATSLTSVRNVFSFFHVVVPSKNSMGDFRESRMPLNKRYYHCASTGIPVKNFCSSDTVPLTEQSTYTAVI